jgi:hypothetical protein
MFRSLVLPPRAGSAGEILKLLQFTEDSEIGVCAEDALQLG